MTIKRMPVGLVAEEDSLGGETRVRVPSLSSDRIGTRQQIHHALNAADGTRQLLVSGFWTMLAGLLAGALTVFVFGGVGRQGAHSNAGWLSLMVAMMSTPFAILLLLLGGAKWMRNFGLSSNTSDKPAGQC